MIDIKYICCCDSEFEQIKQIRKTVFINEQGAYASEEFDAFDEDSSTVFAILYYNNTPAGTARLVKYNDSYKVGRIAILKEYRGLGFGKKLVCALVEKAFLSADRVFVDAQNHAVAFYQKIGFKIIGEEITDRGLPHIPMCILRS